MAESPPVRTGDATAQVAAKAAATAGDGLGKALDSFNTSASTVGALGGLVQAIVASRPAQAAPAAPGTPPASDKKAQERRPSEAAMLMSAMNVVNGATRQT